MYSYIICTGFYYTPVVVHTTNTECVWAVQYFVRSRPPLTRREAFEFYPVRSPQPEVQKGTERPEVGRSAELKGTFSLIFAYFTRIFA